MKEIDIEAHNSVSGRKGILFRQEGALKLKGSDKPQKGVETIFRVSASNHQHLSDMADQKAHILIKINAIMLSIVIGLVFRRLDLYHNLIIPSIILLTVCVLAMTFSILSTRPTVPAGLFSKNDLDNKRVNLLFFGNFYKMEPEDYYNAMFKLLGG